MNSQDIHFGTLLDALNPKKRESQNWGIDISQHLETYLEQLASENTCSTNFAEAALLLQNSVLIYTSKVDHLWNLTVRVLENLQQNCLSKKKDLPQLTAEFDENGEPMEQTAVQKNKEREAVSKKYAAVNLNISAAKSLEFPENDRSQRKSWKFLSDRYHLLHKGKSTGGPSSTTDDSDERPPEPRFLLTSLSLFHEMLEDDLCRSDAQVSFSHHDSLLDCDDIPMNTSFSNHGDDAPHMDDFEPPDIEPGPDDPEEPVTVEEQPRQANARLRGDNLVDAPPSPAAPANDPWEPVAEDCNYLEVPISKKECKKIPKVDCLNGPITKRKLNPQMPVNGVCLPLYILHALKPHPDMDDEIFSRSLWDKPKVASRPFAEIRHIPDVISDYDSFEDFHGFEDYDPDPNERAGGFRGFPEEGYCEEEPEEEIDNHDDDLADDLADNLADIVPDNLADMPQMPDEQHILGTEDVGQHNDTTLEDIAIERLAAASDPDSNAAMSRRVADWHESVRPKLVAAHQRGHFDIHEHGTRILDTFQHRGADTISMQQLVEDVPTQDVPRFFLAALQLANTYNIEIKTPSNPLTMDQVGFTLLSTQRHHEALEDYTAPSQEENAAPMRTSAVHYVQPPNQNSPGKAQRASKKRHRL